MNTTEPDEFQLTMGLDRFRALPTVVCWPGPSPRSVEGTTVIEHSQIRLPFASISGKVVEAYFAGGAVTSDGGVLLLRARLPPGRWA